MLAERDTLLPRRTEAVLHHETRVHRPGCKPGNLMKLWQRLAVWRGPQKKKESAATEVMKQVTAISKGEGLAALQGATGNT